MRCLRAMTGCLATGVLLTAAAGAAEPKSVDFAVVKALIDKHFATLPGYQPGDLISVGDVEPIMNALIEVGLQPSGNEELYDALLPNNNILVQALRTPEGRKFMRSVSSIPNVYNRLDRLSWSPAGRAVLADMLAKPEGPELLRTLMSPEGKKAIEQIAGDDVRLKNFDLPTGRVHTVEEFTARLKAGFAKKSRKANAE